MTQFEKELKKEGEELEKLLTQKASRPAERHIELAATDPLSAAELSKEILNELKNGLRSVQAKLKERSSAPQGTKEEE